MEIFKSNYAQRWCLGINVDSSLAIKLSSILNMGYELGQSRYQVLANKETEKFEKSFNVIVSHSEKDALEVLKKRLTEDDILNKIQE